MHGHSALSPRAGINSIPLMRRGLSAACNRKSGTHSPALAASGGACPEHVPASVPEWQNAPSEVWMLVVAENRAGLSGADVVLASVGPPDPPGGGLPGLHAALSHADVRAVMAEFQFALTVTLGLQGGEWHRCQPDHIVVRQFRPR